MAGSDSYAIDINSPHRQQDARGWLPVMSADRENPSVEKQSRDRKGVGMAGGRPSKRDESLGRLHHLTSSLLWK